MSYGNEKMNLTKENYNSCNKRFHYNTMEQASTDINEPPRKKPRIVSVQNVTNRWTLRAPQPSDDVRTPFRDKQNSSTDDKFYYLAGKIIL